MARDVEQLNTAGENRAERQRRLDERKQGMEQKVCLRLPHSPGTYGIKAGGEVELLALEWAPQKPLIRAVYQERTRNRGPRT